MSARAGIVDEDVEAAELLARRFERAATSVRIGHVADNSNATTPKALNICDDFGQAIVASSEKNLIDAGASHFDRQCSADTARSSGYKRSQTVQTTTCHGDMLGNVAGAVSRETRVWSAAVTVGQLAVVM
jgi:hypothetical protein